MLTTFSYIQIPLLALMLLGGCAAKLGRAVQRRSIDAGLGPTALFPLRLRPLAAAKGVSLSQLALAWVMQQPGVTTPIIGPRTLEQLEDNLKATTITLSAEELKAIDAIVPPGTHVSVYYEADFGPHLHRW